MVGHAPAVRRERGARGRRGGRRQRRAAVQALAHAGLAAQLCGEHALSLARTRARPGESVIIVRVVTIERVSIFLLRTEVARMPMRLKVAKCSQKCHQKQLIKPLHSKSIREYKQSRLPEIEACLESVKRGLLLGRQNRGRSSPSTGLFCIAFSVAPTNQYVWS